MRKSPIVTGARNREYCGCCGKVLDLTEKTERKCRQCGAELLSRDDYYIYISEKECFLIRADKREKGYKHRCSECDELCYMPPSTKYSFCPHCGRRVQDILHPIDTIGELTKD